MVTPGGLLQGAGHQKDQAMIRSLELLALLLPPPRSLEKGKGEGIEMELIIDRAYVMKPIEKLQQYGVQRASGLVHINVLGG